VRPFRRKSSELFRVLLAASGAGYIECQSNDLLLSSMLYESSPSVSADTVLFEDHTATEHIVPGAAVRPRRSDDKIFEHKAEPVGNYVVELDGEVAATGGFLLHYNPPFADLHMEALGRLPPQGDRELPAARGEEAMLPGGPGACGQMRHSECGLVGGGDAHQPREARGACRRVGGSLGKLL
jgi:hypothetical protein